MNAIIFLSNERIAADRFRVVNVFSRRRCNIFLFVSSIGVNMTEGGVDIETNHEEYEIRRTVVVYGHAVRGLCVPE
jgi:hypothetical protein